MAARCAALTADDADAEPLWREAIAAHEGDGRPFEQARTRLLYGEWLRRNRRRAAAREHLLAAAVAFARMGARPWQERAEAELRAAGAGAPAVTADDPLARLTRRSCRSSGWPRQARRTSRSAPSCSCPRAPWASTCTGPSPSSASPHGKSWPATRHDLTARQNDRAVDRDSRAPHPAIGAHADRPVMHRHDHGQPAPDVRA